jgi:hypothetical protein
VSVFVCNACGEDLYTRPARSYLEMEGIVDEREEILRFVAQGNPNALQRVRRRFWTRRRVRSVIFGLMLAIASVGFFLLVSLATVAVLSS